LKIKLVITQRIQENPGRASETARVKVRQRRRMTCSILKGKEKNQYQLSRQSNGTFGKRLKELGYERETQNNKSWG